MNEEENELILAQDKAQDKAQDEIVNEKISNMNEEEKQAIQELKEEINKPMEIPEDKFNTFILYNIKSTKTILNLIEKQQKEIEKRLKEIDSLYKMMSAKDDEIEELKEDNNAFEKMIDIANKRKYRKKYIEERIKEQPNLYCPDFDEIYERYYKQKAEIEQLKEDYQILKDDIEGHRIVYVDMPEFEEKYISKDKIREFMKDYQEGDMLEITGVCKFLLGE